MSKKSTPPARTAAGYFLSIDYASVTRNGKTVVIKDLRIERRLVDGVWVDVKRKGTR